MIQMIIIEGKEIVIERGKEIKKDIVMKGQEIQRIIMININREKENQEEIMNIIIQNIIKKKKEIEKEKEIDMMIDIDINTQVEIPEIKII